MARLLWNKDLVSPWMKIIYVALNRAQAECRLDDKRVQKEEEKLPPFSVWTPQIRQGKERSIFLAHTINLSPCVPSVSLIVTKLQLLTNAAFKVSPLKSLWHSVVWSTSSIQCLNRPSALFNDALKLKRVQSWLNYIIYNEIINEVVYAGVYFLLLMQLMSYCSLHLLL